MISRSVLTISTILAIVLLVACGPSEEELSATNTQVAASSIATGEAAAAAHETATAQAAELTSQAAQAETATAEFEATGTAQSIQAAQADATQTAEAETATAEFEAAGTSEAQSAATAMAVAQATQTAQAQSTATSRAQATATANAVAGMRELLASIQDEARFVRPRDGSLPHNDDEFLEADFVNVGLRDFVTSAQFKIDPQDVTLAGGDFGIQFRYGDEYEYRLVIQLTGYWDLTIREGEAYRSIQDGKLVNLDPEGWNELVIYADGDQGFFLVNDVFIDELLLDDLTDKGDISVATGLFGESETPGAITFYKELTVWSREPVPATPVAQPSIPTPAPTSPPPVTGLTVVNQTGSYGVRFEMWGPATSTFEVGPGQTLVMDLEPGEYGWNLFGGGCSFTQLPVLVIDPARTVIIEEVDTPCGWGIRF